MRVVLQRVARARVTVGSVVTGEIGVGLVLLVAFRAGDETAGVRWMAEKVLGLRVFNDEEGKMNRSVVEMGGSLLVVSQFTLYGDASRGRRPSFVEAARPEEARLLYDAFVRELRGSSAEVATGEFGAMMRVDLVNEGPVTLILDR